ncbi:hypothetical protein ACWF94_03625 [Streptomyces sp. NPDC055078]
MSAMTLAELRQQLAELAHLPDDTPVVMSRDAEGNEYSPLFTMDDALYVAHSEYSGDWYATDDHRAANPRQDWDPAPPEAVPAIFLWPNS